MELPLVFQGGQFLLSALLGFAYGVLYDFLKGLRHSIRKLRHFTDLFFVLCLLLGNLFFALYVGNGEYRIFMPVGSSLGALLYFLLLHSPFFAIFEWFWRIVTFPIRKIWHFFRKNLKKTEKFIKNLFASRKKSVIMKRQSKSTTSGLGGKIRASVQIKTHHKADPAGAHDLRHRHHHQP